MVAWRAAPPCTSPSSAWQTGTDKESVLIMAIQTLVLLVDLSDEVSIRVSTLCLI